MKKYVLFDLDGTLTDPKLGITTCVQYALEAFGIQEPDLDKLEPFIGPPLTDSFMEFYGMDLETAKKAVEKYRERFSTVGLYENEVYPGIPHLLAALKVKGVKLAIASSKPTVFVKKILDHFGLTGYFDAIVGSELDGTRVEKKEVVEEALRQLFGGRTVQKEQVYMVGDRKFDVEGAREQGVESVAVAYGYGSLEELMEAHADYIVCSVPELEEFLLRSDTDEVKLPTLNQRIWTIVSNCLLFYGAKLAGTFVAGVVLLSFANASDSLAGYLSEATENGLVLSANGSTWATVFGYVLAMVFIFKTFRYSVRKTARIHCLTHLIPLPIWQYLMAFLGIVTLEIGINGLFSLTGFGKLSGSYQETSALQYGCGPIVGLLCYGLLAPIAEELLFRGILYGYCRKCLGILQGMLLSAVLFGALHMNMVQSLYGFLFGFLFAYLYEYFGAVWVPIALHILHNLLAYLFTLLGWNQLLFGNWLICLVGLVLGSSMMAYLLYKKKRLLTL